MALGELLYEERGKQTSAETIMDAEEPLTEVTGIGNMKLKDVDVTTNWTLLVTFGNNGIGYSQGKGNMYLDNKEVASYTTSCITKPNSPDVASSRGREYVVLLMIIQRFLLFLMVWLQYMNWNKTMMEITQRNSGNGNKEALYFLY